MKFYKKGIDLKFKIKCFINKIVIQVFYSRVIFNFLFIPRGIIYFIKISPFKLKTTLKSDDITSIIIIKSRELFNLKLDYNL